ncbi:twitch domain-containing radical SAM protein [Marinigracilibium pacificum]|uniref:Twitch domain-containing radical SAM protein n=1 Tax=Marinigracilibium pacificum TaxID=2729599 RepID=A0A848IUH7_9BACT|nr:twitch domain-containing radical SAM protein [Marinigracilibium pacificum]NMM46848.1 twitch domain-containing radical SAM protein [Marinigracilibium pacificum]
MNEPELNKAFCILPWIHFHVGLHGRVQPCCIASKPLGNINKNSLDEIWNGDKFKELRSKMLSGKKVKACSGCYKLEEGGAESLRIENNRKFNRYLDRTLDTSEGFLKQKPVYWDLRFSNVCNFKCRTCWHGASSKWFEEAKERGNTAADQAIIKNIENVDKFFEQNKTILAQADEFYFAGGEPLLMEEHYQLLDMLIEGGAQPKLRYNTNLSTLKFKQRDILEIWKNFKDVEVMVSVDGIGKHGEEIRTGQVFRVLERNIKRLIDEPNIEVKLTPTISTLNVDHIPEIYNWWIDIGGKDVGWYINILQRPFEYNIQNMKQAEKQTCKELLIRYADIKSNLIFSESVLSVISYMNK